MDGPDRRAETGARLKRARLAAKMTQLDVATAVGIQSQEVWKYEHGRLAPKIERLAALAHAVGVRFEWLAIGKGPMRDKPSKPSTPPEAAA